MNIRKVTIFPFSIFLIAAGMLCGLAWLYANSLNHELIFDDTGLLSGSYRLRFGFRNLADGSFFKVRDWFGQGWYWQRMLNVAIHMANSLLVGVMAFRLIRRVEVRVEVAGWAALFGAALWAFNPVAVYAVSYLTQRSILMATFFTLALILAFIEVLRTKIVWQRFAWALIVVAAYVLAIMSKEMAAPVVGVLFLLYVFWLQPRAKLVLVVGGVAAFACVLYAVGLLAYMERGLGAAPEGRLALFLEPLIKISPSVTEHIYALSIINQLWLFFCYGILWLVPLPVWLSIDVRMPFPVSIFEFPQFAGVFLWVGLVGVAFYALLKGSAKARLIGFLLLLPAVLYVSELVFVRVQEPFVLYRSYLWSISLPVLGALVFSVLRWQIFSKGVALVLLCGVLSALSYNRIQSLKDERSVWKDAVEKTVKDSGAKVRPGQWRAFLNYGIAEYQQKNYKEAYQALETARAFGVADITYRLNQGANLLAWGQPAQALAVLEPLMLEGGMKERVPAEAYFNLAAAYKLTGQGVKALAAFDRGLGDERISKKERINILLDAGLIAVGLKRWVAAEKYLSELLNLESNHVLGNVALANVQFEQGRVDQALEILTQAIERGPQAEFYHGKAFIYFKQGDLAAAEKNNRLSLELKPGNPMFSRLKNELAQKQVR